MSELPELVPAVPESDELDSPAALQRSERGWVDTPTSKHILSTLASAQEYGEIAVIHGGTGVGKTMTAKRYAAECRDAWVAEASQATRAVRPLLQEVACACGLLYVHGSAYRLETDIVERMRKSRSLSDEAPGGLLVIDEAQHLGHSQLEELRALHDKGECGLALLGNDAFGSRIDLPEFAALASRVGARVHLSRATAGDINALLDAWGVADAEARSRALALAAPPWGLRKLARALERGTLARAKAGAARPIKTARGAAA